MRPHALRLSALGAVLLLALGARADDPKDDSLPKGAKVRLGSPRLAFRFSPAFVPLPPDYKTIAFADPRDGLRRFELGTGLPVGKAKDDKGPVFGGGGQVVTSADGKRYIIFRTGIVTVRDVATGAAVKEIKRPEGFSTTFAFGQSTVAMSADGKILAQGSQDKERKGDVTVWDVDKAEVIFHTGTIQSAPALPILSADGKLLATRGYGGFGVPPGGKADGDDHPNRTIQVWDLAAKKELFQAKLSNAGGFQSTAVFSPDAGLLAASASDGVIDWWDVKTGKAKPALLGRSGQGQRLAFSPDGKTLAAVGSDGSVQRWTTADGKPVGTTEAPDAAPMFLPQGVAFVDNDRVLAWGAAGSAAVVWEAPSGKLLTPPQEHTSAIWSVGFAAGGKEVITSGSDGRTVRWDAATGKPLGPVTLRPSRGSPFPLRQALNISPDGTRAISAGASAVFDLKTGIEEFSLPRGPVGGGGYTSSTVVSRDLTKAVVTTYAYDQKKTGKAVVWDLTTRQKLGEVEAVAGAGFPPTAAVSPSGTRLVTATYAQPQPGVPPVPGGTPLVVIGWDLKTGKKLGQFEDAEVRGQVHLAVASDTYVVVQSSNGRLRAYDYAEGKGGDVFEAGRDRGEVVAGPVVFTPDGKRFVAAGAGDEPGTFGVRVYDWPNGKVQQTFIGHTAPVTAVNFSPDGKTLATGSQDTTVVLWELKDGQ